MRVLVRPGTDQAESGAWQVLDQSKDRAAIAIGPAAHGEDGGLDPGVVLADRAVLPERVAALVLQPVLQPEAAPLEPLEPQLAPVRAVPRVRRQRVAGEHLAGPGKLVEQQAAAHVVDVVGIAVVRRADGDDSLERRRLQGGDLQAVEAAPRDADHADAAIAPRLVDDPGDGVAAVLELLGQVLVQHQPLAVAGAAQVEPHIGIAVAGQVVAGPVVLRPAEVGLAVGDVFQDRRHRRGLGALRQPDLCAEAAAVRHRHVDVLDLAHGVRQVGDDLHGMAPIGAGYSTMSANSKFRPLSTRS